MSFPEEGTGFVAEDKSSVLDMFDHEDPIMDWGHLVVMQQENNCSCYWEDLFWIWNNTCNTELHPFTKNRIISLLSLLAKIKCNIKNRIFSVSDAVQSWFFSLKSITPEILLNLAVILRDHIDLQIPVCLNQINSDWHLVLHSWCHWIPLTILLGICCYPYFK